jgi:PAS domain S-box-containing protein
MGPITPELLLEGIMETTAAGIFSVDPTGRITAWSRGMEEMTGFTAQQAVGQTCAMLDGSTCFGGPLAEESKQCPLFAGEPIRDKRCTVRTADGGRIALLKRARLLTDAAGRPVGGIEAVTDLSNLLDLQEQNEMLRCEVTGRSRFGKIVGTHPAMRRLHEMIAVAARTSSSVLVTGETGTGKELVAAAIHHASDRARKPFVRVSCAALSETLLESELFGHARGAFTGAVAARKGRFEAADGGTLFLDEIGDVSPNVQTKLLRVLQEREFERVGESRPIKVDIRVIAATNKDLMALCQQGLFREDLYYRLAVIPVGVPPLRERLSDVPLLVELFIERLNRTLERAIRGMTPAALALMTQHRWPGNVRELEHAVEYAFAVTAGSLIEASALPPTVGCAVRPNPQARAGGPRRRGERPDASCLVQLLDDLDWSRVRAAEQLGVSRVTLWKWMKDLGVEAPS